VFLHGQRFGLYWASNIFRRHVHAAQSVITEANADDFFSILTLLIIIFYK
jgi:hypothetical protein